MQAELLPLVGQREGEMIFTRDTFKEMNADPELVWSQFQSYAEILGLDISFESRPEDGIIVVKWKEHE